MVEAEHEDIKFRFSGLFKPESFYGNRLSLLNKNNKNDKIWYARHTLDMNFHFLYGMKTYEREVAEMLFTLRNRGVWGNPDTIMKTSTKETKDVNSVGGSHNHAIPRHVFWMREAWLGFSINEALGLGFTNDQTFTIGLFPFELGRGIALGAAYAIGPEPLGFYTDYIVDQFAPGAKLSGGLISEKLSYDLYVAILENRSNSLSEVGKKIYGQAYERLAFPTRGFGKINFLAATRFIWTVFNTEKHGRFDFEPYALYNNAPEQKIEFLGDSSSKLGTIGVAAEYVQDKLEFGFDAAVNIGRQKVRGWDRNQINKINRNGVDTEVNSHVSVVTLAQPNNVIVQEVTFVPKSTAQKLINGSVRDECENGKVIGTATAVPADGNVILQNASDRFRNPYTNSYEGWMIVGDAGFWLHKKDLQLAFAAGVASGDDDPNNDTMDRNYKGFVGLQEIYSGKRVRSAFLAGGSGKVSRPLSIPETDQATSRFASTANGFNNLVFAGSGLIWDPKQRDKRIYVNPNIIAFWMQKGFKKFDALTGKEVPNSQASKYLGTELALFFKYQMLEDLKFFAVGSVFFPGQHFTDVKGKPISSSQAKSLDSLDRTGFSEDAIPNLGDDTAYTFNFGIEFRF